MPGQNSDRFNAHIFGISRPHLAAEIDDAFAGIDLDELTGQVLDTTTPDNRMTVIRALDDWFGDLGDDPEDGTA